MTRAEAIEAMRNGHKVAHEYFTDDEWMALLVNGKYIFEDGCICPPERFWDGRAEPCWLEGWRIAI